MAPKKSRSFSSKILLFGEYLVLNGSDAIAIPYDRYILKRTFDKTNTKIHTNLLLKFHQYLSEHQIVSDEGLVQFQKDIKAGLGYESTIPIGYGLGSSGALTADIYDHYSHQPLRLSTSKVDLLKLKDILAQIENFFHNQSSGIDPLTSFIGKNIKYNQNGVEILTEDLDLSKISIYNSGISRDAKKAIGLFKEKKNNTEFSHQLDKLSNINSELILSFFNNNINSEKMKEFSELQFETFSDFIDIDTKVVWKNGLDSDKYYMKLCGAGMGGFYLIYSSESIDFKVENL